MPLYLSESDVESLITAGDAVPVIEACFLRMASGAVENVPRRRLELDDGAFAVMSAVDRELGYAGLKAYTAIAGKASFVVCLFELQTGTLAAVIEADALGQRRTGAASGVAAKHLARTGASSLGIIGCGWQAEAQVDAIRTAVPTIERVVAYCRTPERLRAFCARPEPSLERATVTRASRTSSSRPRPPATQSFVANGFAKVRSCAPWERTVHAHGSSTTSCSNERRSSAVTHASRRGSSRRT